MNSRTLSAIFFKGIKGNFDLVLRTDDGQDAVAQFYKNLTNTIIYSPHHH